MKKEEFYFDSRDGVSKIHAVRYTPDDGKVVCVVQIVHGMSEYVERYEEFAQFLTDRGIVVAGNDHLGHGKSIIKDDEKGFFAESEGWKHVVDDMEKIRSLTKQDYPELPYVFFGHSMGSFLTRTYIIRYRNNYDAAIISGTGHLAPMMINAGYTLSGIIAKLKGPRYVSELIDKVAFGAYNKGFEPSRTRFDWLSRDEAEVDKYAEDPLCGFIASCGLFHDMMGGLKFITNQDNINKMNLNTPIFFMSGDKDPVGEDGKGVDRAYKAFCKAGVKDVYMKLYPDGRHEMLNETNKLEVYNDILNWLNSKV